MESEKFSNRKYFIHIIYASTFLLAVFSVIGYLVWNKYEILSVAETKKYEIKKCIGNAELSYAENWAAACSKNAKIIQDGLSNCIESSKRTARMLSDNSSGYVNYENLYKNYVAQCNVAYGKPNPAPNCSLPMATAKDLESALQKEEKMCAVVG